MIVNQRSVLLAALCWSVIVASAVAQPPYKQTENVVYAEAHGVALIMDIFEPTGASNGLAIIDVISGAWHSDRGKLRDHARAQVFPILCRRGFTVFAVRPGSVSRFDGFDMLAHLKRGLAWVREHAATYSIDPERLGMMGASAGGHLACLTAVTLGRDAETDIEKKRNAEKKSAENGQEQGGDTKESPGAGAVEEGLRAVAVFFPPTDLLRYGGREVDLSGKTQVSRAVRRLACRDAHEWSTEEVRERMRRLSPARLVHGQLPPFLFIHGDADTAVPLEQSEGMVAALKKAGVSAELIVKEGGGHPWLTIFQEVEIMATWFETQLGKSTDGSL